MATFYRLRCGKAGDQVKSFDSQAALCWLEQASGTFILKDGRVVFNIAGNKYRLVVWINYGYRVVYIRFIGAHAEYDQINAQTI